MKHNGVLVSRFAVVISSLAVLILTLQDTRAAGVTLITHGLNGDTDGWITAMGNAIARYSQRTTNAAIFKFQFYYTNGFWQLYSTKLGGGDPLTTPGGEMVVLFDWSQLSDGLVYSTYNIADALAPALISTNFVPELGGHALAEFPLHLIGHSRGGSLICELSRLLGENGIWVDQVTTLDAHPLNNDGFLDLPLLAVDAPAEIYENVLFGDSYYQDSNLVIHGEPVPGSFWRQQTVLTGGYTDILDGSHSDIHLWYHGTIDLSTPTTDSEAEITSAERIPGGRVPSSTVVRQVFSIRSLGAVTGSAPPTPTAWTQSDRSTASILIATSVQVYSTTELHWPPTTATGQAQSG